MAKINQLAVHTLAGGTAEALSATDLRVRSVLLIANAGNTGLMYVGDSAVATTSGVPIDGITGGTGKDSFQMTAPKLDDRKSDMEETINLRDVYVIGTSGDKVRVIYVAVTEL